MTILSPDLLNLLHKIHQFHTPIVYNIHSRQGQENKNVHTCFFQKRDTKIISISRDKCVICINVSIRFDYVVSSLSRKYEYKRKK